jgi:hypothetical protein
MTDDGNKPKPRIAAAVGRASAKRGKAQEAQRRLFEKWMEKTETPRDEHGLPMRDAVWAAAIEIAAQLRALTLQFGGGEGQTKDRDDERAKVMRDALVQMPGIKPRRLWHFLRKNHDKAIAKLFEDMPRLSFLSRFYRMKNKLRSY